MASRAERVEKRIIRRCMLALRRVLIRRDSRIMQTVWIVGDEPVTVVVARGERAEQLARIVNGWAELDS